MKKIKGIFGILLMITGMLGTGYAYWMDDLQVYATVATGNFDVEYCEEHTEGEIYGVASLEVDIEDGKAEIMVDKLAPGCDLTATLCFKNTGTVNAILSEIRIENMEYTDEYDIVQYRAEIGENIISGENLVAFKEELENLIDMLKLNREECKSLEITAFIPYDEEQYQKGQKQNCKFEIIFDWRQDIAKYGSTSEPAVTEPAVTEPAVTEPAVTEPAVTVVPGINKPDGSKVTDGEKYNKVEFSGPGISSGGSGGGGVAIKKTQNKFDFKDLEYFFKYLKKQFGIEFIQEMTGKAKY
ncbi:hypothetical protein [Proteocatella sphenisci]|uniref:hypothetical protein n=1 Tax=Proteocatella sphenisci TaxID=181070 RepID=UPI00048C675C|nr:hypothetical protein [Proteocatella sphenisci]